jgi:hypothetical protein
MTTIAGSGSRIQDPDPDPLVRGMDPRIRIRIHPKMSWIRNTGSYSDTKWSRRNIFYILVLSLMPVIITPVASTVETERIII